MATMFGGCKVLTDDYSEGAYEFATLGMFDDCVNLEEIGMPRELFDRTKDQLTEMNPEWFHRDDDGTNDELEGDDPIFLEKYSVTILDDGNGKVICGIYGNSKEKKTALIPDPNSGFSFKEWKSKELIKKDDGYSFIMPQRNVKITVFFEINKYKVTFDTQGHGSEATAQTVTHGETASESSKPSETGWTFGGWYKEATCTDLFDFTASVTKDTTVYAKWTKRRGGGDDTTYYIIMLLFPNKNFEKCVKIMYNNRIIAKGQKI